MRSINRCYLFKLHTLLAVLFVFSLSTVHAAKLIDISVLDKDILIVHFLDGEIFHHEGSAGEEILRYLPELNTNAVVQTGNWLITSADDGNYGTTGLSPNGCYRKKKLNGHAQLGWSDNDFVYEYTYEHWIYLNLPRPMQQGDTYTLHIAASTNSDTDASSLTFDVYNSRSEAIHVNLVGYPADAPHKGADLYYWMGSGGPRDYSTFEANTVELYNIDTSEVTAAGTVQFWMQEGGDVGWYNLTRSDVWSADFSGVTPPGRYRLVVEGVGCSQDFDISGDVYNDPFVVSLRGYFYMRIGESNPQAISPPPRTPLYIPGVSPASTTVYLTTMHPYHPQWPSFSGGDKWDNPNAWIPFKQPGNPTNQNAWGGHSDAADWDRQLSHVVNIYDMLLPFILTDGVISDDDTGITESGNGIPDIIDEARNEVDFWLRLRDGEGYSHGLTNPNSSNELFQAGPTALAAWASAANAAMLADAFRIAGRAGEMDYYKNEAITAFNYAAGLSGQMLDEGLSLDDGLLRGRDLKMMAAAFLYNVTGITAYEEVVRDESVCNGGPATLKNTARNQIHATAAYLVTRQPVHYRELQENMRSQIILEAKETEAHQINTRPSRRGTDQRPAYWQTAHFMDRTLVAHAITRDSEDKELFLKALYLEAGWGLGRNPLNMIQMTTASTPLQAKRSVDEAYTSGRDDGVSGVHPGHTPYINLDDWAPSMVMGKPSALYENSFPANPRSTWPIAEMYFPSRWVWAHNEFTPRQTMRGKMAIYGYLHGLAQVSVPGDINDDGEVDLKDLIQTLMVITGSDANVEQQGDINGDKKTGLEEAIYQLGIISGTHNSYE